MTREELSKAVSIDYGVASKPFSGESFSGDAYMVQSVDESVFLVVVDGVGHGRSAADAAAVAIDVLENHLDEPLVHLVERCHRALIHGRGVAMTIACIQYVENSVTWLGVGNVWGGIFAAEARSKQRWKTVVLRGGIVGYRLPKLQPSKTVVAPGEWLVLATDGVRADFNGEMAMNGPPQEVATRILSRHVRGNDDALVLAAHYRGRGYE